MRVYYFDRAERKGDPFSKGLCITPDRPRKKKKKLHPPPGKEKEMMSTIHQRTQVDDSYECPAAAQVPLSRQLYYLLRPVS